MQAWYEKANHVRRDKHEITERQPNVSYPRNWTG